MKKSWILWAMAGVLLLLSSCGEKNNPDKKTKDERYYVNTFAYNMMSVYYLWEKEIADGLKSWKFTDDPVKKVRTIRYKDAAGNDIDKWTMVTDDYASFAGEVSGNTRSTGMAFSLYYYDSSQSRIVPVVTYTYADSPAREAGLKRGDVILTLNGQELSPDNYVDLIYDTLYSGNAFSMTLGDGRSLDLTPRQMYLDPVNEYSVFDEGGVKYAYLHFTNFTQDACPDLVRVFREFKEAGVTRLILDLRYNGGGYMITAEVLASLMAPATDIENGNVFLTEIYNELLTQELDDEPTRFRTDFSYKDDNDNVVTLTTAGANPGFEKVYVITTGGTASASECIVCGLSPYMDMTLVGEPSHGKYCAGIIVEGPTWYGWAKDDIDADLYQDGLRYTDNWAIYVMYSRYADKDGVTLCMPDGLTPDVSVKDNPMEGAPLGDPAETMLAAVLAHASGKAVSTRSNVSVPLRFPGEEPYRHRGVLIRDL